MIPVSYNVRSLLGRKTTTVATALGIGLVVFVLAAALMLAHGLDETLEASGLPDNAIVMRKGADGELASSIDTPTVGLILAAPGVKKDAAGKPIGAGEVVAVMTIEKTGSDGEVSNVSVRGGTPMSLALRPAVRLIEGRPPQPGTDEVMVGSAIAGRFAGLELGGSFELKKNRPVKVVGVFDASGSSSESEVWGDVETVRTSFGRDAMVSSVTVQLESPSKFDGFSVAVENDKRLGLEAMRETEYFEKQSQGMAIFILVLGIFFAVLFGIGAMIGAMITMYGAVAQRSHEIGTLRALGFSRFNILTSFLLESVVLAVVGGAIGMLAALCMSFVTFSMVNFVTFSELVFKFTATPGILIASLVVGAGMGLLGGFFPAVRAARMNPITAMRD